MLYRLCSLAAALALAPIGLTARSAASPWTCLTSANFTLVGDASERELRQVALQLEQFRETVGRLLPAARVPPEIPTLVFVFSRDKSYRPYKPLYQGKTVDVGGYFVRAADADFIALSIERGEQAFPVIFHEYAHLMLSHAIRLPPPWLAEGLAEYYSTFRLGANGRQAQIGKPIEHHVYLLREHSFPLLELLAVDQQSPLYNESDKQSIFYAESWAWMHYLLMGNPPRTRQLMALVNGVTAGIPVEQALRSAFGAEPSALQAELFQYVRGAVYRSVLFTFDAKVSPDQQMKARSLTQGETEAVQGDLLVQMGRLEEAEARLDAVRQREPELAGANTALGVLRVRQKRLEEAVEFFHRASALDPAGVAGRRARTWLGILEPGGGFGGRSTSPPARGTLPDAGGRKLDVKTETAGAEPLLRPMNEGEKRERGDLTEIECRPDGIVLHVRSGERAIRVTAKRFEDVDFITYRDDLKGSVPCGPRTPPDPVYVTWRPISVPDTQRSPPIDGQAVAVEFLPKRVARPAT